MHIGRIAFSQLIDFLPKREFDKCVRRYSKVDDVEVLAHNVCFNVPLRYIESQFETEIIGEQKVGKMASEEPKDVNIYFVKG